jgi:hypothetical protein
LTFDAIGKKGIFGFLFCGPKNSGCGLDVVLGNPIQDMCNQDLTKNIFYFY